MTAIVEGVTVVEVESNAGSITLTEPSGASAGDLLVAVVCSDAGVNPDNLSSNTGWTEIVNGATSGRNCDLIVEYIIRGASAPDLTWEFGGSQEAIGIMYRISGSAADDSPADPIGASGIDDGSSTTPTCPSITTEADDSLVLRAYAADFGDRLSAEDAGYPGGTTGRFRKDTGDTTGCTGGAADEVQASAGATGTAVWGALTTSSEWFAASIEIKAGAAAPPATGNKAAAML